LSYSKKHLIMRKYLFLFLIYAGVLQAQQFQFLSKNAKELTLTEFQAYKSKDSLWVIESFLENGKKYNKVFIDSIVKTKTFGKYKQHFFRDTIENTFTIVLRKMSDDEIKKRNEELNAKVEGDKKNKKVMLGKSMQNLVFKDMDGAVYTSEELKGKVVVVNFWFTKCVPCIREIPDLNALKKEFGTDQVLYFAITYDNKDLINEFVKKHPIDFTIIPEDKNSINQFLVGFYPTNFILDQAGKVVFVNDFFMQNMFKDMRKTIKKCLN
jgi:thiol-disulfide isomerase/thioredoxin